MAHILVVEDDDLIRNYIARLLKIEGHTTTQANNGVQAMLRLRETVPDAVISDVNMPEMDGFTLLETIRSDRSLAALPVMLLTALDDRASMRRGMSGGADDYLGKPFTREELMDALGGLLKKKQRVEDVVKSTLEEREEELRSAPTCTASASCCSRCSPAAAPSCPTRWSNCCRCNCMPRFRRCRPTAR